MLNRERGVGLAVGALAGAAALTAGYASLVERRAYRVRYEDLPLLPPGSVPIGVLHLADIHMAPGQHDKVAWLQGLRDLEPDLIVNTGDSLGHRDALPALREALEGFAGVPGVFVHGSNDYYAPGLKNPLRYIGFPQLGADKRTPLDTPALEALYAQLGWQNLNNAATELQLRGTRLKCIGTDDAHIDRDDLDAVQRAGAEIRSDFTLGVTHAPYTRVLNGLVALGADALFAGHTHGGQVRIPGGPALTTNSDLPTEHADGLTTWRAHGRTVPLQVSAGIGTSIFAPFRLGTPPEAVFITLSARR